jgi:hypothetical protein
MCILPAQQPHASVAATLDGQTRQQLAVAALAGVPIAQVALEHHVSRKFVYQQLHKARRGLRQAFSPPGPPEGLLFWLPVTKPWLRSLVLGLTLLCHSPYRGVTALLSDLFDYPISLGSVHNIVAGAAARARQINDTEDLSAVKVGAHDEIYQGGRPVLVGVDTRSTYCYLLSQEEHRDGDTWGVRLLELAQRGFAPQSTIADFAKGLRRGQQRALPGVPCRGDVFHCLYEATPVARYLENRAYDAIACVEKLQRQQRRHEWRNGRKDREVSGKLTYARQAEARAVALADDVATLLCWLRHDILAVAGPDYQTRRELLDWVVAELAWREGQCEQQIRPLRVLLQNQGDDLLAFAAQLDEDLAALAGAWQVSVAVARAVLEIQQMPERGVRRWQREAALRRQLGARYHGLNAAVEALAAGVVRASSLAENVNSRLRTYFFLRRQLGPGYLGLLRFFLNHRRLARSERDERVGKSPAELLSGQEQTHWLELLGYGRFVRAA